MTSDPSCDPDVIATDPKASGARTWGFPRWEHESPFTIEGEIERLGAIGRNLSTAPRWTRLVARALALMVLLPVAFTLLVSAGHLFR